MDVISGFFQVEGDNVRYAMDSFYFMPESSQLIFTHYPLVSIWQLLEKPISQEEFESLVPIKSTFFKFGLRVVSHPNAVIETDESELTIVIGCAEASDLIFTKVNSHKNI